MAPASCFQRAGFQRVGFGELGSGICRSCDPRFFVPRFFDRRPPDMPRLDQRLQSVCRQIRGRSHADIGSDHGHLLKALLATGRIDFGIAVENKRLPFQNSQRTLQLVNADVRFGSGLEPVGVGEVTSASICGMGGGTIRKILERSPDRIPTRLVLQPNNRSDAVRDWAWHHRYRLVDEWWTEGRRSFEILVLEAVSSASDPDCPDAACADPACPDPTHPDPAYHGLAIDVAIQLGPFHLRRRHADDVARWREESEYLRLLPRRNPFAERRRRAIEAALSGLVTGTNRNRCENCKR